MADCLSPVLQGFLDYCDARREVAIDFEVPESKDGPPCRVEGEVDRCVAGSIASDLGIPEWPGLTPVVVRVPVPEGSVDEDRYPSASPGEVWLASDSLRMKSPAPHTLGPQRSS